MGRPNLQASDPLGNIWWLQERVEDLDPEEVGRRMRGPTCIKAMEETQVLDAPGMT